MNNIWKYSLVLAFSIILDQLLKGSAQSLISLPGGEYKVSSFFYFVRQTNEFFPLGIKLFPTYANTICWTSLVVLIFWSLKRIIYFRNRDPLKGWGHTLLLMSFFTNWLDRISQGNTLNYLALKIGELTLSFSIGDLSLCLGFLIFLYTQMRKVSS